MKVSVIVPTYERAIYFERLYRCFDQQTYQDKELLIYDDSAHASSYFDDKKQSNVNADTDANTCVRYFYTNKRLTIGEKRNYLIEQATGDIIIHFDDDDFYAPHYIAFMVKQLEQGYDFVKLSGWFIYQVENRFLGYWDTANDRDDCYLVAPKTPIQFVHLKGKASSLTGFGFSYAYRKQVYEKVQYEAINFGEDNKFITACIQQGYKIRYGDDPKGLVLHIIHTSNTSRAFPQYVLPKHLVTSLFGMKVLDYIDV